MRVGFSTVSCNPSFKKVDLDFLQDARQCWKREGNVSPHWLHRIDEYVKGNLLSKEDAADTLAEVRGLYIPRKNKDDYDDFVRRVTK